MQEKIKNLRNINIIHSFINLVIVACHIIIYTKIFWISKESNNAYYSMIYIISFCVIIPIFFTIIFSFKTITNKILNISKLIIKYFMFLEMIFSLIFSISLAENQKDLSIYFYTCPFYYDINDIDLIFNCNNYENVDKIEEKCQMRRCFINEMNNNNIINEKYLCNFNIKIKKKYCSLFSIDNEQISNQLIKYYNYCENYITFYSCQKPYNEYNNKLNKINSYDYICPNKSDELTNILLLFFFLIIDIIFLCSPWLIEITYIEEILAYISPPNNDNLKETNHTSKEQNDSNSNDNSDSFRKEPTETIIVDNSNNNINNNINNKDDLLNINRTKINLNNAINININNNKIEENKSKSDIQLIDNKNNNIFRVINNNSIYKIGKK